MLLVKLGVVIASARSNDDFALQELSDQDVSFLYQYPFGAKPLARELHFHWHVPAQLELLNFLRRRSPTNHRRSTTYVITELVLGIQRGIS